MVPEILSNAIQLLLLPRVSGVVIATAAQNSYDRIKSNFLSLGLWSPWRRVLHVPLWYQMVRVCLRVHVDHTCFLSFILSHVPDRPQKQTGGIKSLRHVTCGRLTWQWKWGKGQMILQMPMKKSVGKAGGIM